MNDWLAIALGATAGVLMKMGQWRKTDGGVDWWRAAGECMSIPGITFIVAGGVAWLDPNLDIRVVSALAALVAVLGTAGIEAALTRLINRKIDTLP